MCARCLPFEAGCYPSISCQADGRSYLCRLVSRSQRIILKGIHESLRGVSYKNVIEWKRFWEMWKCRFEFFVQCIHLHKYILYLYKNLYFYTWDKFEQDRWKENRISWKKFSQWREIVALENLWKISVARCVCVWIFNRRCHVNSITFNRIPRMPVWLIGRALIEYKISSGKYRAFSITGHGRASIRHTIRGAPLPSNSLTNFVNYARL